MGASHTSNALDHAESSRLRGVALVVARVLWLALALPTVALTVIGVSLYYRLLLTPCAKASSCGDLNGMLTLDAVRFLQERGISISVYAALHTVFYAVIILTWWVIAFLIFARRSDDLFALVAALFLMFYGVATPATSWKPRDAPTRSQWASGCLARHDHPVYLLRLLRRCARPHAGFSSS
jgi:hypothetical protein